MTVTANHRDRLRTIRERTHTAREARARARRTLEAAQAAGDADAQAIASLALDQAGVEVETSERLESMLLSSMAGINGNGHFGGGGIFDDPERVETLQRLGSSSMPIGRVELGPLSSREELVQSIESGSWHSRPSAQAGEAVVPDSARVGAYYGVVPQLRRRLRLLDLIPTQPMDSRSFGYSQETGSFDTACETAEAQIKPAAELDLDEAEVIAKTIAHWIKLKKQQLDDVPALATTVTQRLTYGVMRRVESQVLAGDGVGENLLGILATPGIGDVAFAAGEALTDLSLDGITETVMADAEPSAVVLNPVDYAVMLKTKATGSGIRLDTDGAFATPPDTMWGLPAIASKALPQGQALVGDWSTGCTLFVREAVNVKLSDADQDDFTRNRVTALGEGRFGLAVWQPSAFTLVHFA